MNTIILTQRTDGYNVVRGEIEELLQEKPAIESPTGYYEAVESTETPCLIFNGCYSGRFDLAQTLYFNALRHNGKAIPHHK
jgi:hypothetical protein